MSSPAQYEPGAARGAEVKKHGEQWTLVLVVVAVTVGWVWR